jgi:hypothetical protein
MPITLDDHRFIFHNVGGHNVIFEIANQDNTSATDAYYGYVAGSGAWIIQKAHTVASARIFTYAAGQSRTDYDALFNATTGIFTDSTPALEFTTFDQLGDDL